jgi:hypothetical protein
VKTAPQKNFGVELLSGARTEIRELEENSRPRIRSTRWVATEQKRVEMTRGLEREGLSLSSVCHFIPCEHFSQEIDGERTLECNKRQFYT